MTGKLYLIPNIIHPNTENQVVAPIVLSVIQKINYYLVENERTARRFLSTLMKLIPQEKRIRIEELELVRLDKRSSKAEISKMLKPVKEGMDCGVISESGCPGIADPGSEAVISAHQSNIEVIPVPGPSSIFLALMASGMNGQSFAFHGYLPIKKNQLISKIRELENNCHKGNQTQLFIETPYRNQRLYDTLISTCSNHISLCIAIDITGPKSVIITQSIVNWKKKKMKLEKAPCVFLLSS